jgi:hypothetical protein
MAVRSHRCFVHKEDNGPSAPRLFPELGESFVEVTFHGFGILLVTFVERTLRAQSKLSQQPANRTLTELDAKLAPDQLPNDLQGPETELKLVLAWIPPK